MQKGPLTPALSPQNGRGRSVCVGLSRRKWGVYRPAARIAERLGFSLLELLLAVALLLVLASLYWGPNSSSKQRALQVACQRNLQKLYVSMQIYANDFGGRLPQVPGGPTSAEALSVLVPRYNSDTAVFICPASDDSAPRAGESLKNKKISFAYYMGRFLTNSQAALLTDKQVDTSAKTVGQAVFSSTGKPPGNSHGSSGGNLLFCDGHVEASPPNCAFALGLASGEVLLNP